MGSNHEAGEVYCKRYAEKGFAGYSFDFPGGSRPTTENKSDGDQMKMTPVTEAASNIFPNCEYYVIEGSGHGFGGEGFETAVNYGLEYLYKNN